MANIKITTPLGWTIPKSSTLSRDWVKQVYTRDMLEYAESQKHNYDCKTIFHSVSYCKERGYFYALGPPLLNLDKYLLPITARFSIDGGATYQEVDCVRVKGSESVGLNIRLMHVGVLNAKNLVLELSLANGFTKSFHISNVEKAKEKLVINTLQKNNDTSWILDWINYYRTFRVFNFHIYDNGSSNFKEYVKALRENISDDTTIKITKWPFNYGIVKLGQTMFTQKASILDFVFQNQNANWAINCDIDEYIYIPDHFKTLYEYFESFEDDVGCIQFSSFDAPLVRGVTYPENLSIRDLIWRMRQHKEKFKNGFRPSAIVSPSVHFVNLKRGMRSVNPIVDDAFYLHALPLNTGWTQKSKRQGHRLLDGSQIVKDERIAERIKVTD